jgi:hypothetical protein
MFSLKHFKVAKKLGKTPSIFGETHVSARVARKISLSAASVLRSCDLNLQALRKAEQAHRSMPTLDK